MDYELIYYTAGRTAEMEHILDKKLSPIGLSHSAGEAATNKSELADALARGLKKSRIIFVIGGLNNGYDSTDKVLSKILISNDAEVSSKRVDGDKNSGYIIESDNQTIVVLPDNPDESENMLDSGIIPELIRIYSLKVVEEEKTDIDGIMTKLDEELSGTQRVRLISAPPKPKLYKRSRRAKALIGILFASGAALAVTAFILVLIYYILPFAN